MNFVQTALIVALSSCLIHFAFTRAEYREIAGDANQTSILIAAQALERVNP